MKEDPVDTWELGRNDSVEAITGTRNVFVDYPELAFILFGEAVPANYQSPSKATQTSKYKINATSGNTAYGSVSVSGSMISASPKSGYEVTGFKINSGSATVTQSGNSFIVNATSDVSITINFAKVTCKHPDAFDISGSSATCDVVGYTDGKYCPDCQKYISGHTEIAATGHKYTDSKDTTCNVCGYTKGSTTASKPATTSKPTSTTTSKPASNNSSSNSQNDTTVSSGIENNSGVSNDTTSSAITSNEQVGNSTESSALSTDENVEYTPDGIPNIITDSGKKSISYLWIIILAAVVGSGVIGGGVVAVIFIVKKSKES